MKPNERNPVCQKLRKKLPVVSHMKMVVLPSQDAHGSPHVAASWAIFRIKLVFP
jgi:hypothetical protein